MCVCVCGFLCVCFFVCLFFVVVFFGFLGVGGLILCIPVNSYGHIGTLGVPVIKGHLHHLSIGFVTRSFLSADASYTEVQKKVNT